MIHGLWLKPSITLMKTILKHPIELVKTRMQIQGELTRDYKKTYSGTMQSAILIAKEDGFFRLAFNFQHNYLVRLLSNILRAIISLWRGLNAGLAYQVVMNGTRLTLFDFMKDNGKGFTLLLMR